MRAACISVGNVIACLRRALRCWWLRHQIAAIDRDIDLIRDERINGHLAERELVKDRVFKASALRRM